MKHYREYKYVLINEKVKKTVQDIKKIIEFNEFVEKNNLILNKSLKKIVDNQ